MANVAAELGPYAPGQRIGGRYVIRSLIGLGGNSAVYLAEDERLARKVALKAQLGAADGQSASFQDEARATAAATHPNLVTLFDWGTDRGIHYLVMEYLPGPHLDQQLRTQGDLEEQRALAIAADIASGLGAAHRAGIVHRDVKPQNILLDEHGTARLADFGIASSSTKGGAFGPPMGTALYMAPEQANGQVVDARSDVYSLGAVLYQMLTGNPPFRGNSVDEVVEAHRKQPPTDPRAIRPDLSPQTASLVMTALAKDPSQRFSTVEGMKSAIQAARRAGVGLTTAPLRQTGHRRRPVARRRRILFACIAAGVAASALVAVLASRGAAWVGGVSTSIVVPKFAGLTQAEAEAAAAQTGLTITFAREPTIDTPAGIVVTQDPREGLSAPERAAVRAVVSQGVLVPNMVGDQCAHARQVVSANGWTVRPVRWRTAAAPDFGKIVAQDPTGDAVVPDKQVIAVQVAGPVGPC